MGKATGISSQFRGKIGNVIGYLAKNRAGRYEQIVKSYQPVVANPQSYAQALARVPVGPVQRVCSALLPIIQRGFEGVAYGEASKSEFLSYNLKYFRGPFMPKGTVMVPPGAMLLTKGSLQQVTVRKFENDGDFDYVHFSLELGNPERLVTVAELSNALLKYNPSIKRGEQLTLVMVELMGEEYVYHYGSFFIDPTNTVTLKGLWQEVSEENGYLCVSTENSVISSDLVAAAIIRSQPYGESSFKRSTTFLSLSPLYYQYNDDAAVQAAVASYRTGEDPEDWEDDPTPEYQQLAYLCMVNITEDMVLPSSWLDAQGKQCLGYVTKGGEIGIFYTYSSGASANVLVDSKGGPIQILAGSTIKYLRFQSSYQPSRVYSSIYGTL